MNAARLLAACLALLMAGAGLLPTRALAQDDADAGLAEADTAVIAQGVAPLPDQAVWAVSRPTAEAADEATVLAQNVGFALATDGPLVVSDQATGARLRLSGGEAAFNAEGAPQVVASAGEEATDYTRLSLVTAELARDAPEGGPTYVSEPFPAPDGDRDVDLVTAVLDGETSWELNANRAPALVYAPDGLRYAVGRAAPQELEAGEAVAVGGRVTLFAPEEGEGAEPVRAYAAVVGAELPAAPVTTPTSPTGEATLSLELLQCPSDSLAVPGGGETPAPCDPDGILAPVPGVLITFENAGTGARFTLTTDEAGRVEESIAAGDYRILSFDDVQASTRAVIASCSLTDPLEARPDVILETLPLRDGESVECALYADGGTFDVAEAPAEGAEIAFAVLGCGAEYPEFPALTATSPGELIGCDGDADLTEATPLGGAEVLLSAPDGSVSSGLTSEVEPVVFSGLAPGDYTAVVTLGGRTLANSSGCVLAGPGGETVEETGPINPQSAQTVGAGDRVVCTVVVALATPDVGGRSTLNVNVVDCPTGSNPPRIPSDNVAGCGGGPAPAGLVVELTNLDTGGTVSAETGTDGVAVFPSELAGTYALAFPGVQGGAYGVCAGSGGPAGTIDTFSLPAGDVVDCFALVLDPEDVAAYTDPADADGDFLSDSQEARLGTDPTVVDTDGDGADDGFEVRDGTDPLA